MYIYIYIYTYTYIYRAKYYTPEINTSEIIVDFQWDFPMDCQWHFPTEFRIPVVCSKGLSRFQWISTGIVPWTFSGIFQHVIYFVISGVEHLP